jgi:antitoxin (DNA-binding transcriptional repressor) of toxin-antitoxin stability system
MVVKRVNIHDAKTNLSRYLAELAPGEMLVLCNRNRPVAEVRSLRKKAVRKPRIGAAAGKFAVPDSFFEPLPDEIIQAFGGE